MQTQTHATPLPPVRIAPDTQAVHGLITGHVAMWGDTDHRDAYDTWFDIERPPEMALDYLPFPLMYEHGMDSAIERSIIGKVTRIWFDEAGIRFEAQLDTSSPYFGRIVSEIRRGKLRTSSATADHTAEFDGEGRFRTWPLVELSLTASPAEDRMTVVQLLRSTAGGRNASGASGQHPSRARSKHGGLTMAATRDLEELLDSDPASTSPEELIAAMISEYGADAVKAVLEQMTAPDENADGTAAMPDDDDEDRSDETAIPEDVVDLLEEVVGRHKPKRSDPRKLVQKLDLRDLVRAEVRRVQQSAPPANVKPVDNASPKRNRIDGAEQVRVVDRYAHLKPDDMAWAYVLIKEHTGSKRSFEVSDDFRKALAIKALTEVERGKINDYAVLRSLPGADKGRAMRANEVMQSDLAGFGDEWVYTLQSTQLWEAVRNEPMLYSAMLSKGMDEREIPQGYESDTIPLEGADPTWYVAAGATAEDASSGMVTPTSASSKFGTGKQLVTIAKLSARIYWQGELQEDSIINVAEEAARKIRVTAQEQIETILINGDTTMTASTNINLIDGTPAAAPNKPAYTLLNGLLKLGLVTNTANSLDVADRLDEATFLKIIQLLPKKDRRDRQRLLFVLDSDTALASTNIPSIKTRDVFSAATLEEGVLSRIFKTDIYESPFMELANAAGKVPNAGGTLGRILLVRPDRWAFRWKRRIQTSVTYTAASDTTEIVAHMRMGLAPFSNEAAAVGYGVPVTID